MSGNRSLAQRVMPLVGALYIGIGVLLLSLGLVSAAATDRLTPRTA
jgi:hypothetical protein